MIQPSLYFNLPTSIYCLASEAPTKKSSGRTYFINRLVDNEVCGMIHLNDKLLLISFTEERRQEILSKNIVTSFICFLIRRNFLLKNIYLWNYIQYLWNQIPTPIKYDFSMFFYILLILSLVRFFEGKRFDW